MKEIREEGKERAGGRRARRRDERPKVGSDEAEGGANERKKNGTREERKDGEMERYGGSGWLNEEGRGNQGVRKCNKRRVFLLHLLNGRKLEVRK